ncbi:hypothetical protein EV356DRAFT_554243, partial [Viridothelium virens]
MAEYYGNAYITIAAGSATSSANGFLNLRFNASLPPCELEYSRNHRSDEVLDKSTNLGTIIASLPPSPGIGPLTTRGWTFQEAVLSRRMLIYGRQQMIWKCQRINCQEDGLMWRATGRSPCSPYTWPKDNMLKNVINNSASFSSFEEYSQVKAKLLNDWYVLLERYTARKISDSNDRMTAMAGIAQKLAIYLHSRYWFGIWETDMIRGLLWRNGGGFSSRLNPIPLQRTNRYAPSWSWGCVDGSIHVEYTRIGNKYTDPRNLHAEILDIRCMSTSQWDPIRAMDEKIESNQMNAIFIRGILKPVLLSDQDFLQYRLRDPWRNRFMLRGLTSCPDTTALLEAIYPKTASSPQETTIVGIAVFDTASDKTNRRGSVCYLRLTTSLGLVL